MKIEPNNTRVPYPFVQDLPLQFEEKATQV